MLHRKMYLNLVVFQFLSVQLDWRIGDDTIPLFKLSVKMNPETFA
jgi:hypothetical protein